MALSLPLDRDLFSCGDRSVGKQWGLIDWFLYGAPYSIEEFFKWIYQNHLLIICVKICNSSSILQFFHIPPNNVSDRYLIKKLIIRIYNILHFFNTLLLFFVVLLRTCLTKFESIKLNFFFITLLYAIAVNMLFLEFTSKKGFSFNYTFDAGQFKSVPCRNWKLLLSIN